VLIIDGGQIIRYADTTNNYNRLAAQACAQRFQAMRGRGVYETGNYAITDETLAQESARDGGAIAHGWANMPEYFLTAGTGDSMLEVNDLAGVSGKENGIASVMNHDLENPDGERFDCATFSGFKAPYHMRSNQKVEYVSEKSARVTYNNSNIAIEVVFLWDISKYVFLGDISTNPLTGAVNRDRNAEEKFRNQIMLWQNFLETMALLREGKAWANGFMAYHQEIMYEQDMQEPTSAIEGVADFQAAVEDGLDLGLVNKLNLASPMAKAREMLEDYNIYNDRERVYEVLIILASREIEDFSAAQAQCENFLNPLNIIDNHIIKRYVITISWGITGDEDEINLDNLCQQKSNFQHLHIPNEGVSVNELLQALNFLNAQIKLILSTVHKTS
jgi:hypothetical protein